MLRHCAVVGDPAGHSLSPAIHRAGYEANELAIDYQACTVAAADFPDFVRARIDDPAWIGLSITAPHKEALLTLGEADEPSRLVGGGNTIVFGAAGARVYNTDVSGFRTAWLAHGRAVPKTAAILGNGATARSILLALARLGTTEVTVLARRPERAQSMVPLADRLGVSISVQPLTAPLRPVDLLASTIPAAAVAAQAPALVAGAGAVFDVVYDPWPTPLTQQGLHAGRLVLSGLDLLAGQAVDQFYLLTGRKVTFEQCRSAAGRELNRRRSL